MKSQNIYNQITNSSEIQSIFENLVRSSGLMLMKLEASNEDIFLMRAIRCQLKNGLQVYGELSRGKVVLTTSPNFVLFHFRVEDKKIIGSGEIRQMDSLYHIKVSLPIFSVQRREHFRLRLPSDYFATCRILNVESKMEFRITDISAGGVLIENDKLPMNLLLDQQVEVELLLPGKEPILLLAFIRRVPNLKSPKLGLKFAFPDKSSQREMVGLVMQLYRRFFK